MVFNNYLPQTRYFFIHYSLSNDYQLQRYMFFLYYG